MTDAIDVPVEEDTEGAAESQTINIAPTSNAGAPVVDDLATAAVVVVAMSVIATMGFRTIFSSSTFFGPALAGAALGALVVVLGRRFRLLFGEILGVGLIAPLLVGPLAVGGTGFYRGLVYGWTEILSATPPVDPTPGLKALPFIAAFVGALAGTELSRLRELPGIAVIGPIATLTITALFTEQTRRGSLTVGLVLLIGLLLIARLHHASLTTTGLLVLALVLGMVGAIASAATLALPYADESTRFDLRDLQTPPWDPLAIASPLTEVKAGLKLAAEDNEPPVLRIRGDVQVNRWRAASLPAFNGIFWGVAEADETEDFVSIDTRLPRVAGEERDRDELTFDVDVLASVGHWVPTAGVATRVEFSDVTDARMSLATGTIGIPEQLLPGNSYELSVTPWIALDDDVFGQVEFVEDDRSSELELLPPVVRNLAADFSTGVDQLSGQRVIAIRDNLQLGSYDLSEVPGHTFGRIAEFLRPVEINTGQPASEGNLRSMAAHEELYAATGAVLTRLSDIPVRVAVGYVIPDDRWQEREAQIFASDANAWIEVFVEGSGWMPVDVTPDRERQPEEVDDNTETQGVPIADPPKTPPLPEEDEQPEIEQPEDDPEVEEDLTPEDEPDEVVAVRFARVAIAAAGGVLLAVLLVAGSIVGYKALRRKRRRTADVPSARIAGAWTELVDRVDEAGGRLPAGATPAEAAQYAQSIDVLARPEVSEQVERLADQVSAAAFHPVAPNDATAEAAWETYDHVVASMHQDAGNVERLKRAVNPSPLREGRESEARVRDDVVVSAP